MRIGISNGKQIPVFKPLIEKEEIAAAVESLELGWLGMGSYVKQFEDCISEICCLEGSDCSVVAVSTGHAALHLSLEMIGVGPGDEVITPSFNNVADFQAIKACRADPVFVDIEEDTLCIDVSKIEELISKNTKCIIAMDYGVFTCDHDSLVELSNNTGIPVLHDAAHSFGSTYRGRPIGNQHQFTIFSFDPVKTVTCVDGGAIIVKGADAVRRLQAKRLIGMTQPVDQMYANSRAWTYDVEELGYRYHMANLHAAVGVSQLKKIDVIRASRQETCRRYNEGLKDFDWLVVPNTNFTDVTPFLYFVRVLNGMRAEFREYMRKNGVDTGIHWQPGHRFTYFKNCRRGSMDVTDRIAEEIVTLPLHSKITRDDVEYIIEIIRGFV